MLEQFENMYSDYLEALQKKAREYKQARKTRDYEGLQDIRDALAEGDILMAPDFESEALGYFQAMENDYKECEAIREGEFRKLVGRNKGEGEKKFTYSTQKEAENAAFIACRDSRLAKMDAEKMYKKVRELYKKKEQLFNSIASRLRKSEKL